MIKLIIGKLDNQMVIGEYNSDTSEVSYLFQLTTVLFQKTFHYTISPLILPFCMTKSVTSYIHNFSIWVEVDLKIHHNLVSEYIRLKEGVINPDPSTIPEIAIH